ncbi:SDR family oxidoreductase [Flammeovirga aprica]|uniref:dTDP-4-dehydrorhamnose reductase n=1 Tax=Flammeovirga aprica JL-4 TaxID=694437 RepID=A0A7X9P2I9_9BACT|nr:SDR family oxidoreductase [Flammeovirga aprica]NME68379.1 SDR family oxidoreductase [Flammeovirga aprica JL-4]
MSKTILITGANGLLGQHLTQLLTSQNTYNVIATGRGGDRLKEEGYKYLTMDITDEKMVRDVLQNTQPSIIFHCAAISKVENCEDDHDEAVRQNVTATQTLLQVGKENGLEHFIYLSTDFVFDGEKGLYEEDDQRNPPNFYGQTKLMSEDLLLKEKEIKIAIVRTCLVYGQVKDMSRTNIMTWVKDKLSKGEAIKVVNDQYRTPTYAGDLANGCALIAAQGVEGIFHISGKDYLTPYAIALQVAEYLNLSVSNILPVTASTFVEHGRRPLKTGFTNNKAYDILNYQPISFYDGMRKVLGGDMNR